MAKYYQTFSYLVPINIKSLIIRRYSIIQLISLKQPNVLKDHCLTTDNFLWSHLLIPLFYSHLFSHSFKKWKDSLETRTALLIFSLELEISGVAVQSINQNSENGGFYEELLLSEKDFEAILATFCFYNHGTNASEAVQRIATNQKEYHKCSSCYNLLNSQNRLLNQ